jgi:PDZ domain
MDRPGPARPRLSRETRLLLVTILVAMAALWALARIRFPERPAPPNPVTPLLTQLAVSPGFDDLATQVSTLESRLLPSLVPVDVTGAAAAPALRVRDDIGATLLPAPNGEPTQPGPDPSTILAHDAVTGLALVRIPGAPAPELTVWSPQRLDRPRYLFASDFSHRDASLRPVFVGRLHPATNPGWPGEILVLPVRTAVAPGDLLFTTDGALAGLVIPHAAALALVPGETLLNVADLLRSQGAPPTGWLGIEVHGLTPALASATGARAGVIVSRVHPDGPAAAALTAADVIEAANGEPIASLNDWRPIAARVRPGDSLNLTVRRRTQAVTVTVTGAAVPTRPAREPLGLKLRTLAEVGAEVVDVASESAAARAEIVVGDVIIAIGDIQKPTAAQVARAFAESSGRPLLAVLARGQSHRVVALNAK